MANKYTPEQEAKCVAMYEAGYTAISISELETMPLSTVKRWMAKNGARSGSTKSALVDQARLDLLNALSTDEVKGRIAGLMLDDLVISNRIREKIIISLESIKPTDMESAALSLRAITAASTALKNTSDIQRSILMTASEEVHENSLPSLTVTLISPSRIAELNKKTGLTSSEDHDAA